MTSKLLMFQNLLIIIMASTPSNKRARTLPGFVPASALCFDKGCCPEPANCARVQTEALIGPLNKMAAPDYSKLGRSANVLAHCMWEGAFTLKVQRQLLQEERTLTLSNLSLFNSIGLEDVYVSFCSNSSSRRDQSSRASLPGSSSSSAGPSGPRWPKG